MLNQNFFNNELNNILGQMKSKNFQIQDSATKQFSIFIQKNRENFDDIISKISNFFDKHDINDKIMIKVINDVLKIFTENNTQIINFLHMVLPLLFHIIYYNNRTMIEFDLITKTIGNLIKIGGPHTSTIIEGYINQLFDKFINEQIFKNENTKYALISLLKEYTKNSPVISYNTIIANFDLFLHIVDNFKDSRPTIRVAIQELVEEFLQLLSNRDTKLREEYMNKIFSKLEKIWETTDNNNIHGIILMLRACMKRREFFDVKYSQSLDFLHKHKNHKNNNIKLSIIEILPYFAEYDIKLFEVNFFDNFLNYYLALIASKPDREIKCQIYITFGKLSSMMSRDKFLNFVNTIMKIIKIDFDKYTSNLSLELFECMGNLMKNYKNLLLNTISYEDILNKMFSLGFAEPQIKFLTKVLEYYDEKSVEHIKILIIVLNVISFILCERSFHLRESKHNLMSVKNLQIEEASLLCKSVSYDHSSENMNESYSSKKSNNIFDNKSFIKLPKQNITIFMSNLKNSNRHEELTYTIRNALKFLGTIKHECFHKDILSFFHQYCLKYLEENDLIIKDAAISLANSAWITMQDNKIDNDIEYMMNIILDSYLNLVLNDSNDEVKIKMLNNIDERYDKLLATNKFFNKLILTLNFTDNNIREKVVSIFGRILHYNFTTIITYIKKSILDIFNRLDLSLDNAEKVDAIILLNFYVKYSGQHILDYVEIIFSTLIKILKINNHDLLNVSVLNIVSELIGNNKNKSLCEEYYREVLNICINNLKDNSSPIKQEISLKTVLAILENSLIDWKIYFDYPELVNLLIQILTKETNKISRLLCLKIFGFIGAMDKDRLEKIWSIHQNELNNNFLNENYEIDEYNNNDDEEIIDHKKRYLIKSNMNKEKKNIKQTKVKKKLTDFHKMMIDQLIDPCTYHAIRALMNILKDNSIAEASVQVIGALGCLLKSLQENDAPCIELILPTLLECIEEYEVSYKKAIFDNIFLLLKNFKVNFKYYIKEVLETIEKYISDRDFQPLVFSILTKMLEDFLEDMEIYFPHLIPILLKLLNENNNNQSREKYNPKIDKYIFNCFILMSEKLSNYLSIIIPEILKLLNSICPEYSISPIKGKKEQIPISDDSRHKEEEIIEFLDKIILNPNFSQFLPSVVNSLLKYITLNPNNLFINEKVMKLLISMCEKLQSNFLIFLPSIIKTIRHTNINVQSFIQEIKDFLEKDYIVDEIKNRKCEVSKITMIKRMRSISSNSASENKENINKTRKAQIDKEKLVREFDNSHYSIKDDWREWFKGTSKILFEQSPSFALYYCSNVADYYTTLLTDLYNYAFISCWRTLNDRHKIKILKNLINALNNQETPEDILLIILNLSEFIEREEHQNHVEFIDFLKLGEVAQKCKAYAKALYYKENYFRNNTEFSTLENLISLYYNLKLPEAAIGILNMAQQNRIKNEDDWYLKLHRWKDALEFYNKKLLTDSNNGNFLEKKFICLDALCDWESVLNLSEDIKHNPNLIDLLVQNAPSVAKASMNLGEWDKLKFYILIINEQKGDEAMYEKNFFSAVMAIKEEDYRTAKNFIDKARDIIEVKIKSLLSESYERSYSLFLENYHLYELEEIIQLKKGESFLSRDELKKKWDSRFEIVIKDIKTYERILSIRNLVFSINEDYEKHLELAKICRKEDRFATCLNVLNRLKRKLGNDNKNVRINVELNIQKCLYENNSLELAINNLKYIINNEINNLNDDLKSKIYCYFSIWNINKMENNLKEENVKSIIDYLQLSTQYDKNNYKAWHNLGLLNYKYFESLRNSDKYEHLLNYASNSIIGFTKSVCIGGKNISRTLQDILRIIDVWFIIGQEESIDKLVIQIFDTIDIDIWLLVIPQLLARVNIKDERIKNTLSILLRKIGYSHPRALIYPLIVLTKSKSKNRRLSAELILDEMKKTMTNLIDECSIIIEELNRCALLLHEEWSEAIDQAAKMYFQCKDIEGMIKILMEVHDKMNKTPLTMNEIHFHQLYRSELLDAESYLKRYIITHDEMDIKQSWDIYHTVFRSMNDNFNELKFLDLENVSPKLYYFKESEICVPGLYKSGYPVIKIKGFEKQLSVFSSKQHPRKIVVYGSDRKEYMFLLKGHEDLRQDERAMQLFGLVNTLLSNDADTSSKNLYIKRFQVIPLSHNTGIIGWVPNCDTLHQLIREYRNSNKIIHNVESRLMYTMCPKFENNSLLNKLEVFKYALQNTRGLDLYNILWKKSKNSESWLDRRTNYSRSLAVMSMVGYILGLGDRHPSNLMLDRNSGKIIHIDFGDCFEVAMKREKYPEKVPFRLTRMLIKALEVSGIEGTFRITCENVMRVLRANKDSLVAILASFVHDPLISFRLLLPLILKKEKLKKISYIQGDDKKQTKSITKENINEVRVSLPKEFNQNFMNLEFPGGTQFDSPQKRKMESTERQLFNLFEERDEIEIEELNKIAKMVLERITDKLQGTDFLKSNLLDVKNQVDKLIKQATSHENLSQSYMGWCPFW